MEEYSKSFGLNQNVRMTYPFVLLCHAETNMHRVYDLLWSRIFRLDDAAEKNRTHILYEEEKKKYDNAVRQRDKKFRGNFSSPLPPAVDKPPILLSNVMERDYRYWISATEYRFLSCLCNIAYGLRKHRYPLTTDTISQENCINRYPSTVCTEK